jgi:hypothetical protein
MTKRELIEALVAERYGPISRHVTRRPTSADVAAFESLHDRARQRVRRDLLKRDYRPTV